MITTLIFSFLLSFNPACQPTPGDTLTLKDAYNLAYQSYPTAKKVALQQKITDLNNQIARSAYFPQITVEGKATYQSEVPEFPSPNPVFPTISKDQYEASLNVIQTIFNGGAVGKRKELQKAKGQQQVDATKVDLYQIRKQVNQVYYGILLSQQELKTIGLLLKNLKERLSTVRSQVEHGALLASQQYILQAELINVEQDSAATQSNIAAGYGVLSELIGQKVALSTALALPEVPVNYKTLEPQRPQYQLFKSSLNVLEQQQEVAQAGKWPHLSAFGTASYGRPGLNFLNDDFHGYYMVGLQLKWGLWDLVNAGRQGQSLQIQQKQLIQDRKAFTLQLNAQLERINGRIQALRENIERDKQIVHLRKKIVESSASQLKHGVITATEYVTELTSLGQAQLAMFVHRVQLSQAKTDYMTTLGAP
ncbi:MAG TPA: TolC family protein [Balneolaceae bacterium]|nr:TolC family protein [Balneolaceae bacterium]